MASKPRLNIITTNARGFVCTHEQGLTFRGDKKQWWLDKIRLREIATARRLEKERAARASVHMRRALAAA